MVRDMAAHQLSGNAEIWRCLHCRGRLTSGGLGLTCAGCGREYPVVAGIPLLVREPRDYFRAERASLIEAAREARQRRDLLDRAEPYSGLADAALERHRDVLDVEAAQAETLLALLEPSVPALEALADHADKSPVVRQGWRFDRLTPYLLRDWTNTSELQVTNSRIGAALEHAFPDPRGKSIAFAGCGAGGLLAEVSADFARVLGFDLTLPILAVARQILDGKTLDLALPRVLNERGCISLGRRDPRSAKAPVELLAMDVLDTALPDRSIDCVVTVFLTDILADPRALADEVHRVLPDNGIWINYGPSGHDLKALWRFDQTEAAAFFKAAGFAVVQAEARRGTDLDISCICPSVSFRNAVCYLTVARKTGGSRSKADRKDARPRRGLGDRSAALSRRSSGAPPRGGGEKRFPPPARPYPGTSGKLGGRRQSRPDDDARRWEKDCGRNRRLAQSEEASSVGRRNTSRLRPLFQPGFAELARPGPMMPAPAREMLNLLAQTALLVRVLEQNTQLTEAAKALTERIESLTAEVHYTFWRQIRTSDGYGPAG